MKEDKAGPGRSGHGACVRKWDTLGVQRSYTVVIVYNIKLYTPSSLRDASYHLFTVSPSLEEMKLLFVILTLPMPTGEAYLKDKIFGKRNQPLQRNPWNRGLIRTSPLNMHTQLLDILILLVKMYVLK